MAESGTYMSGAAGAECSTGTLESEGPYLTALVTWLVTMALSASVFSSVQKD